MLCFQRESIKLGAQRFRFQSARLMIKKQLLHPRAPTPPCQNSAPSTSQPHIGRDPCYQGTPEKEGLLHHTGPTAIQGRAAWNVCLANLRKMGPLFTLEESFCLGAQCPNRSRHTSFPLLSTPAGGGALRRPPPARPRGTVTLLLPALPVPAFLLV